jgi:DNA-binding NtrC family response regulator
VLAETDAIGTDEFPQIAARSAAAEPAATLVEVAPPCDAPEPIPTTPFDGIDAPIEPVTPAGPVEALELLDPNGDVRPLEEIEADAIRFAITHYRGQMSEVARRLRIGRSTLYRKLESLGLSGDSPELHMPVL